MKQHKLFATILHDINGTPKTPSVNYIFAKFTSSNFVGACFFMRLENSEINPCGAFMGGGPALAGDEA
ncbi:MAG: hypothetical protein J6L58_04705 [Clostridia bacterium]|nr:hypothetical protein [Clostridia bacterium]